MEFGKLKKIATDEVMSFAELREDEYYKKIPNEKISYYVDKSMDIGLNSAKNLLSAYEEINLEKICKDKNIGIEINTKEYGFEIIKLRGKYEKDKNKIILYDKSIKRIEAKLQEIGLKNFLDYKKIKDIQLVHELFHFLEEKEIGVVGEKLKLLPVRHLAIIKREYPILKTSDIAAHIFTKEILSLSFHPKLMDYYYLLATDYIDYKFLMEFLLDLKSKYKKRWG